MKADTLAKYREIMRRLKKKSAKEVANAMGISADVVYLARKCLLRSSSVQTLKITNYQKMVNGKPLVMVYEGSADELQKIMKADILRTAEIFTNGKRS